MRDRRVCPRMSQVNRSFHRAVVRAVYTDDSNFAAQRNAELAPLLRLGTARICR